MAGFEKYGEGAEQQEVQKCNPQGGETRRKKQILVCILLQLARRQMG